VAGSGRPVPSPVPVPRLPGPVLARPSRRPSPWFRWWLRRPAFHLPWGGSGSRLSTSSTIFESTLASSPCTSMRSSHEPISEVAARTKSSFEREATSSPPPSPPHAIGKAAVGALGLPLTLSRLVRTKWISFSLVGHDESLAPLRRLCPSTKIGHVLGGRARTAQGIC